MQLDQHGSGLHFPPSDFTKFGPPFCGPLFSISFSWIVLSVLHFPTIVLFQSSIFRQPLAVTSVMFAITVIFGYLLHGCNVVLLQSAEDCVLFYYLSKKSANYKQMVRRQHAAPPRTRKPKPYRPPAVQIYFTHFTFHYICMYTVHFYYYW